MTAIDDGSVRLNRPDVDVGGVRLQPDLATSVVSGFRLRAKLRRTAVALAEAVSRTSWVVKPIAVIVVLACFALPAPALAQQPCARPVALFESVQNSVQLVQASTKASVRAARQVPVCAGDTIRVGDNSRAVVLMLPSNTPLRIDQNSEFFVTESPDGSRSFVDLLRGALLFISRVRRSIEIRTPFVNAAVEGTEFVVRVQTDRTVITVFEGAVRATNPLGALVVGADQQAVAIQGQAPQLQIVVHPRDAVQWALYYEPVLASDSFEQLVAIPESARDATFYVRRAGLLLGVGQLDEARSDLDQAQKLDPSNGEAHAVRAIVSVALNDKEGALDSGRMAVDRAPRSSSARMALSYALQANFELEAAREAVTQAVEVQPNDGAAWARLAELRLMLDDVSGAVEAARRAASLSLPIARAQTVLGFALLAQLKLSDAREAFDRGIDLEPDNPLARLGLGLVRIRLGRLSEGRSDLELAVALNPDNALFRSYLGKAYFEERRDAFAGQEFDLAKMLDPLDPTAWFYDAIRKQTLNRPVEALRDLQRSVELNNNRAVYRSRLLLDADLAVRGARLGRIYRDLGFEHLALLEGWKSVSVDPDDHSAHRLLADNYLALPRHGIARDSELLQAQLLQPLNINPVQPRLADNGLVFLDDTGVSGVGFNEFTRLFAANQLRFIGDGLGGDQGTRADNLILSGIFNRFSYSLGQFYFDTNGVRENNDLRQTIYSAFLQAEITPATGVQMELRSTNAKAGDRFLLFDPQLFLNRQRSEGDTESLRLGIRRNFAPGSILIGSYVRRTLASTLNSGTGFRTATDEDAHFLEVRHLHKRDRLNVTAGMGYYQGDNLLNRTSGSTQFPPAATTIRHANGYLYAGVNLPREVTVFAGASGDGFDNSRIERNQVNPKVGFTWTIAPTTTMRAAYFRALKRTLISSQTIEPTHVAGFNQFFDDVNATDSWRYGVALDHTFAGGVYTGAEASFRDLSIPVRSMATGAVTENKQQERLGRAYLYLTAARWLALGAEYRVERLIRDPAGRNQGSLAESTSHKLAAEARVFFGSGVFGRVRVTAVDQRGRFLNARDDGIAPDADRFGNVDASIGYRLPNRWGIAALDVQNVFDNTFRFQDSAPDSSRILLERLVTVRLTITF